MTESDSYSRALKFLFEELPVFQHTGAAAYKPGLTTSHMLDDAFGNPHTSYPVIHIAGTNGKGSTAHTLAAVLQSAGYKVGLYTSPHLLDFRERIRVDGRMISHAAVVDFVDRYRSMSLPCSPSFFELTTIMAFDCFARAGVDVAVVEVGLGGRFDTTNVVTPVLSVITNISLDHTAILGPALVDVAGEKAGIIKRGIPVVVGEAGGDVLELFSSVADALSAPMVVASRSGALIDSVRTGDGRWLYRSRSFGSFVGELEGECQPCNAATVLAALEELCRQGMGIGSDAVRAGFSRVCELTGFTGRWTRIRNTPMVIVDTGHNPGGWIYIASQLRKYRCRKHLVLGFAGDKDVAAILSMVASIADTDFYLTEPSVRRALPVGELARVAASCGIISTAFPSVALAYENALAHAGKGDLIFVGGSGFVVADLMAHLG